MFTTLLLIVFFELFFFNFPQAPLQFLISSCKHSTTHHSFSIRQLTQPFLHHLYLLHLPYNKQNPFSNFNHNPLLLFHPLANKPHRRAYPFFVLPLPANTIPTTAIQPSCSPFASSLSLPQFTIIFACRLQTPPA